MAQYKKVGHGALNLIPGDGLHSVIRMCAEQNQKWYSSQKKWYFSHFAKTQKEIHTLSPEPDAGAAVVRTPPGSQFPAGDGQMVVHERAHAQGQMRFSQGAIDREAHSMYFTVI